MDTGHLVITPIFSETDGRSPTDSVKLLPAESDTENC